MKHTCYLSLGSNIGKREAYLQKAITLLENEPGILLKKRSSFYETSPVGGVIQDDFINLALEIETELAPHALLLVIHRIEKALHRKRIIRWGPRTIDIDILFFDHIKMASNDLTIPHQEVFHRLFVLIPLIEILPVDFYEYKAVQNAIEKLKKTEQAVEIVKEKGVHHHEN